MHRRPLILLGATVLALAACANTTPSPPAIGDIPTQLPSSVLVDDKLGVAVETAYQAASLAERTAVKAHFVTRAQRNQLIVLDNQAYELVCETRSAYDIANGLNPNDRRDKCPASTRGGALPSYADAARSAITTIKALLAAVAASTAPRHL